jgi:2-keto-4-pentenoate hydratase/2-oxohepta-3-ene-1,7-dioic acid hydratase in catechol pathway
MRLVSYWADDRLRPGLVADGEVFDAEELLAASPMATDGRVASTRALLERYGDRLSDVAETLQMASRQTPTALVGARSDVHLGPPVPDPAKVLCVGHNYHAHVVETGKDIPEHPNLFAKFGSSLTGPNDELALSGVSAKLDYEGELAVVMGRACRGVSPGDAMANVAGVMILNDITARDLQFNATQWLPGKAVDASTPCGPELVTLDELGDPHCLDLATRVNGAQVQHASTDRMIFSIPRIISYISHFLALAPGDVIATGTPEGIGSRQEPPRFLRPGDVVEVEIAGVGSLRNPIR